MQLLNRHCTWFTVGHRFLERHRLTFRGLVDITVQQSLLSIATASPLLFALALSAQFRMWQLTTRRLSAAEHGGFNDFKIENPDWLLKTLNPQIGKTSGVRL